MRFAAPLLLALLVSLAGCRSEPSEPDRPVRTTTIPFDIEGELAFVRPTGDTIRTIQIEIAESDSARERGLMQRVFSEDSLGMLFPFERAQPRSFWMVNTPTSLDIMFFGADSTLLNVGAYTTPYSQEGVPSAGPAQFVVETRAGFAERYGITPGDRITWRRTDLN